MTFHPSASVLAVLLVASFCAFVTASNKPEIGLKRVSKSDMDETCSSQIVAYSCVTKGQGATEIMLGNSSFELRHSTYENGANVTMSRLGGDITVQNLSRTSTTTENGTFEFLYRIDQIVVRVNEDTRCQILQCRTRFDNDVIPFGNQTVTNIPPKPRNIRVVNQTENETTIAWDPVNDFCSSVEYNISTTNCGSCPSVVNGYNLTCRTPKQRQQCNISVRAVTQCAMSESESETFTVPGTSPENTPDTSRTPNIGPIVGGVLGGVLLVLVIIVPCIIVLCIWNKVKPKTNNGENDGRGGEQHAIELQEEEIPKDVAEVDVEPEITTQEEETPKDVAEVDGKKTEEATEEEIPKDVTEVDGKKTEEATQEEETPKDVAEVDGKKTEITTPVDTVEDVVARRSPAHGNKFLVRDGTFESKRFSQIMEPEYNVDNKVTTAIPIEVSKESHDEPSDTVAINGTGESHPKSARLCTCEDVQLRLTKIEGDVQELQSLKSRVDTLESELDRVRKEYKQLEEKYSDDHKAHVAEKERLTTKIRGLEQQLSAAKYMAENAEKKKKDSRRCKSCGYFL